jgi:SAM-dependent methyltransferase
MTPQELSAMIAADERHWWYRGRRRVLHAVLDGLALPPGARILDAGCGSGRTLDDLARLGDAYGVDLSPAAASAAHDRGHKTYVAAVEELPFADATFDLVTCLDVIEHTPDDEITLAELLRVTRPGGRLLVTVPAYPALWSSHDEANQHYRRYTRGSLLSAAVAAGWRLQRDSYFNSALLAPAALVRLARRRAGTQRSELSLTPRRADRVLEMPNAAEAAVLRSGGRIPAGLSLLAVLAASNRIPMRAEPAAAVGPAASAA